MTDSLSQYCPNCEAQANTIEELRAANERWAIAFNQAEERANGRIKALQANKVKLRKALAENARLHNRLRNIRALATRHLYERGPNGTLADIELFATVALQETER